LRREKKKLQGGKKRGKKDKGRAYGQPSDTNAADV
jgi:hypothetical protein